MDNDFTQGLFVKLPPTAAPEFVLLNMSVKPHEFFTWCQKHLTEESRGWVNFQILRSKDGSKLYGKLSNYKSERKESDKDRVNQESAEKLGMSRLSDEELTSLDRVPF